MALKLFFRVIPGVACRCLNNPGFLEILFLFGEKIGPVEKSFSSFLSHCRPLNGKESFVKSTCSYGKQVPLFR